MSIKHLTLTSGVETVVVAVTRDGCGLLEVLIPVKELSVRGGFEYLGLVLDDVPSLYNLTNKDVEEEMAVLEKLGVKIDVKTCGSFSELDTNAITDEFYYNNELVLRATNDTTTHPELLKFAMRAPCEEYLPAGFTVKSNRPA